MSDPIFRLDSTAQVRVRVFPAVPFVPINPGDGGVAGGIGISPAIPGLPADDVQEALRLLTPVYQDFTDSSLSIAGILPVIHNLDTVYPSVEVWDDTGQPLVPDGALSSGVNAIAVEFATFRPLTGTWKIKVER